MRADRRRDRRPRHDAAARRIRRSSMGRVHEAAEDAAVPHRAASLADDAVGARGAPRGPLLGDDAPREAYCQPFDGRGPRAPARVQGRRDRHRQPQLALRHACRADGAAGAHPPQARSSPRRRTSSTAAARSGRGGTRCSTDTFPVHRGGGTKQLEYPLSLLKRGWSILIYPEGGRSKSGRGAAVQARPRDHGDAGGRAGDPDLHRRPAERHAEGPARHRSRRPCALASASPSRCAASHRCPKATTMLENAMRELAGMPPHRTQPAAVPAAAEPAMVPASGGGAN